MLSWPMNPLATTLESMTGLPPQGGLRTELIDKLHGSRVFDDTLNRLVLQRDERLDQAWQAHEAKEDERLKKRRQSISSLIKEAGKGEVNRAEKEFQPNEDQWTKEVRLIMLAPNEDESFIRIMMKNFHELGPYNIVFSTIIAAPTSG
jgi:hypothetical protein